MNSASLPSLIKATIKRHIKWYSFPLIYFLVTSLICAYAWYTKPLTYSPAIQTIFKRISLNPTLIITGVITVWIIVDIILISLKCWLKERVPTPPLHIQPADKIQRGFWSKAFNISLSVIGVLLILTGLSMAVWMSRPYITFLFSESKIEALEEKASILGQVQSDETKEAVVLSKVAEIPEQSEEQKQKDNIKQSEAMNLTTTERSQSEKGKTDIDSNTDTLGKIVDTVTNEVIRKSERLKKKAEAIIQSKENRLIIPTALVDAPILEGIDMEKLSEGVCHIPESTVPGQGGNCIIEGHSLGEFGWWRPQGPFNMLEILEQGIRIHVFYNGKKYIYRVKEKKYTDVNDPTLYDFSPRERLTLITCTTTWNPHIYTDKRTVIVAYPE